MPQEYTTALAIVAGLIFGYLFSSVLCLYVIKFLNSPPKTQKNERKKNFYLEEDELESEPEPKQEQEQEEVRENLVRKRLPPKDSSWSDMHCRREGLNRGMYLRRAMSTQEDGYRYRIDESTDSFAKGTRYSNDEYIREESVRNLRNTEQTLIEMALEANRQMNNQ